MDKTVFYPREKLLASDLNLVITNTESYGQEIITNLILGADSVFLGLQGTGSVVPDDEAHVSPGLAYHSNGRKIKLVSTETLKWNGSNAPGEPVDPTFRRIDVVCIRHASIVGASDVRYFVDANPSSPTFGQQISNIVVTEQDDSYEFFVMPGTEAVNPTIPAVPVGYIPLFLVYIHSRNENAAHGLLDPTKVNIKNDGTGWTYVGAWRPNYLSDIDHYPYLNQHKITVASLEDKLFDIPVDQDAGPGVARATTTITPDWTQGIVTLNSVVDVTSPISRIEFFGSGLNDLTNFDSNYDESTHSVWQYRIEIDGTGSPNTFKWRNRDGGSWTTGVAITGSSQLLDNGIRVTFGALTGHAIGDAWEFDASDLTRQPVYGENNTAEPEPEFYIFGKITSVIPGAVTVTFYRGNPQGVFVTDYWTSNCNVDVTLTYPLRVPLRNLPTNVFRNEFQTGLSIDMNLEQRIENIENGFTLGPLFLRRDASAPPANTLDRQVIITYVVAAPFLVNSPTAICTNLNADNLDTLHSGQNGPHNNGTGQNYIPYVDGSYRFVMGMSPVAGITGMLLAADGDCRVMLQGRTTTSNKLFIGYYGNNTSATHYGALQILSGDVRLISAHSGSSYKPLTFWNNGAERMRVDTNGNVCINTTSSSYNLNVNNTIHIIGSSGCLYTNNISTSTGTTLTITGISEIDYINTGVAEVDILYRNNTGTWQVGTNNAGNGTSGNQFYVYGTSGGYTLTVQYGINRVGINTSSPSYALHVAGTCYGNSSGSYGVYGNSTNSYGVRGTSTNSWGIVGDGGAYGTYGSGTTYGLYGNSSGATGYGVYGYSSNYIGVYGEALAEGVHGFASTGVGVRGNTGSGVGVRGEATTGVAVEGTSGSGWAGYFSGPVSGTGYDTTSPTKAIYVRVSPDGITRIDTGWINVADDEHWILHLGTTYLTYYYMPGSQSVWTFATLSYNMFNLIQIDFDYSGTPPGDWPQSGTMYLHPGFSMVSHSSVYSPDFGYSNGSWRWNAQGWEGKSYGTGNLSDYSTNAVWAKGSFNGIYIFLNNCTYYPGESPGLGAQPRFSCSGLTMIWKDYSAGSIGSQFKVRVRFIS